MKEYRHIFFDLDHTLWDFNRNSRETLQELYEQYELEKAGKFSLEDFLIVYESVNERLWDRYRQHQITKEYLRSGRFIETLHALDHPDHHLAELLAVEYISRSPYKGLLFPFVHETFGYLKSRYSLHIITNGFPEVQHTKMKSAGLTVYFSNIFISEEIGLKKPDAAIFQHAVDTCQGSFANSLMIGDNIETDLEGASGVGMDHVFFNPEKLRHSYLKATHEISCLSRLIEIL